MHSRNKTYFSIYIYLLYFTVEVSVFSIIFQLLLFFDWIFKINLSIIVWNNSQHNSLEMYPITSIVPLLFQYDFLEIYPVTILVPLLFHINFRIILPILNNIAAKNSAGNFIEIVMNLNINLRIIGIFTMLSLLIHEHSIFPHLFRAFFFLN